MYTASVPALVSLVNPEFTWLYSNLVSPGYTLTGGTSKTDLGGAIFNITHASWS